MRNNKDLVGKIAKAPLVGSTSQYWQLAPRDVYQRYLSTARQVTGAQGASVLVASSLREHSEWILLHDGKIDPIPELANLETAAAAIAENLRACLRNSDLVFRYGGAASALLLTKASEEAIDAFALRYRAN